MEQNGENGGRRRIMEKEKVAAPVRVPREKHINGLTKKKRKGEKTE